MSKKLVIGLIVVFVVSLALPMAAQAQGQKQPNVAPTLTCLYKGPLHPLSLNQVYTGTQFKTIKAQKEIFECYEGGKVGDPKALKEIVEIELFTVLIEDVDGDFVGWDFFATRCVKKLDPRTPPFMQWYVDRCNVISEAAINDDDGYGPLPVDVKKCTASFGKKPYVGGVIEVEDPVEMVTDFSAAITKTVKVNKEVFRCFESGDETRPLIYDIELYTEIIEPLPLDDNSDRDILGWAWYCVKDEKKARLLGCSFNPGWYVEPLSGRNPRKQLQPENGQLNVSALMPFVTLQSAGVRPSAGKYVFEAQGYNIEGVQVQVYNLSGKRVFSAETAGNSLSWNGLSSDGRPLPNGVYLYVMTVQGTYGDLVQTKVQKLAILR